MKKTIKQSKYKTIVKFENGMEIKADPLCWILYTPSPRNYSYFATMEQLFSDLLDRRIKDLAAADPRKTITSLAEAISRANQEINDILVNLITVNNPRLEPFETARRATKP